jgi:hypothetical protein
MPADTQQAFKAMYLETAKQLQFKNIHKFGFCFVAFEVGNCLWGVFQPLVF